MNSKMKRALAELVEEIRESDAPKPQKIALLNISHSFHEFLTEMEGEEIEISEEEAEEILSSLPVSWEEIE